MKLRLGLDLRYSGQAYEIPVWFDDLPADGAAIRAAFSRAHQQRYGYARAKLGIEVVNYRVRAMQAVGGQLHLAGPAASAPPTIVTGEILHAGSRVKAAYANRASLPEGYVIDGPAVIEEPTSTTLVPPGWRCSVLKTGDLMLERSAT
jgi:N-methylhydantoinase A